MRSDRLIFVTSRAKFPGFYRFDRLRREKRNAANHVDFCDPAGFVSRNIEDHRSGRDAFYQINGELAGR